jgi:hypothetical protein
MKTTQGKATFAYITLTNMGVRMLPAKTAYKLYMVKKALESTYEFGSEQETKYVKELGLEIGETGNIKFKDSESRKQFAEKRMELYGIEVELNFDIPTVDLNEMKEVTIAEIETLEGFINFK